MTYFWDGLIFYFMKTLRLTFAVLAFLSSFQGISSQVSDHDWDSVLESLTLDEDLSEYAVQELLDLYESVHAAPLNINAATPDELRQLPFLTESQIEDIQAYVYLHGPMKTLGELQLTGLDYNTRQILKHFVMIGDPLPDNRRTSLGDVFRWGHTELAARMDIPMYRRNGFLYHSEEELERWPNRSYLGGCLAHSLRCQFNWNGRVRAGFSAEQDAGEPFFGKNRMGYDFYSPYLFLSGLWKGWTLAIGNYRAGFGRGLLMGSGFSMGKLSDAKGAASKGLKPHSSVQESGYFQGAGVSYTAGRFTATLMGAYTPLDAILAGDSLITSFKTDGYHRTPLEWSRKHDINLASAAANLSYRHDGMSFSMTVLKEALSHPESTGYALSGLSLDWSVRRARYALSGEMAYSEGSPAVLAQFECRLYDSYTLNAAFRYYSPDYKVLHSSGLSESGITNEAGFLIGLEHSDGPLEAAAWADFFYHPEACYSAAGPSFGFDLRGQAEWRPAVNDCMLMTIRFKDRQKDCKGTGQLEFCRTLRARLKWERNMPYGLKNGLALHYTRYDFVCVPIENGWALSDAVDWSPSDAWNVGLSASFFMTDGSNSSVSAYEKGLRYGFNFQTMSGTGTRLSFVVRYKCGKSTFSLKTGSSIYSDRDRIGSSQQAIDSNHKEDINLQFIRKFSVNLR